MSSAERRELYETLVRAHAPALFRFAYRLCGQACVAEDLVQETYQEAWRGLDRLREPHKARGWMFQILRFRHAHWVRDRGRARRADAGVAREPAPDAENAHAHADLLQRALDALDERFRVPFLMVFVEGLTCQETADALGMPLGTVLSRVHRARSRLQEFVTEHDESPRARLRAVPAVEIPEATR